MCRPTGARRERRNACAAGLRRGRLGRPPQLHRGAPGHPDHRSRPAAGADRPRAAAALRVAGREAGRAAARSTPPGCRSRCTLNDVVCCYLGQRGRREEAYTRLRSIMREVRVRAAAGAAPARADHRLRPLRHHDLRPAARAGGQSRALRRPAAPPRSSPTRRTASPTCPSSAASCSARSCITCSAGSRHRRPTSSPTRTCSSSSARCSPST